MLEERMWRNVTWCCEWHESVMNDDMFRSATVMYCVAISSDAVTCGVVSL